MTQLKRRTTGRRKPDPLLPEEHHDTADGKDHGQKETTEEAKPTNTQLGSHLVEVKDSTNQRTLKMSGLSNLKAEYTIRSTPWRSY